MNAIRLHVSAEDLSKDYLSPCKYLIPIRLNCICWRKKTIRYASSHLMSIIINSTHPSITILINNKQTKKIIL